MVLHGSLTDTSVNRQTAMPAAPPPSVGRVYVADTATGKCILVASGTSTANDYTVVGLVPMSSNGDPSGSLVSRCPIDVAIDITTNRWYYAATGGSTSWQALSADASEGSVQGSISREFLEDLLQYSFPPLTYNDSGNNFTFTPGTEGYVWATSEGEAQWVDLSTLGSGGGGESLADGAVTTPKLADDAVTQAKIADGAVGTGQIANSAVTNAKITDGTIATVKLASASTDATADTIAVRRPDGTLSVGTPVEYDDAVSKEFLEDSIEAVTLLAGDGIEIGTAGSGTDQYIQVLSVDSDQIAVSSSGIALGYDLVTWLTTKRSHPQTIGDGSATSFTINHGCNTRDVTVTVCETASPYGDVPPLSVERTTVNSVTVTFSSAPASNAYRVLVQSVGFDPAPL